MIFRILCIVLFVFTLFIANVSRSEARIQIPPRFEVKTLWTYQLPGFPTTLAIDDTAAVIVVGDYAGMLTVLNRQGEVKWTKKLAPSFGVRVGISPDGKLIAASDGVRRVSIYDSSGTFLWAKEGRSILDASFSANGLIVLADESSGVKLFDSTGNLVWVRRFQQPYPSSATISHDGSVIAVIDTSLTPYDDKSNLYLVNINGTVLWSRPFNVRLTKPLVSSSGELVVIGAEPGTVYALDGKSGETLWSSPFRPSGGRVQYGLPRHGASQVALASDGRLAFAQQGNIINATSGRRIMPDSPPASFGGIFRAVSVSLDFSFLAGASGAGRDAGSVSLFRTVNADRALQQAKELVRLATELGLETSGETILAEAAMDAEQSYLMRSTTSLHRR